MKGAAILLSAKPDGAQAAALVIGGRLEDLLLSRPPQTDWGAEALAQGRVERILRGAEGGKGAVFLKFGHEGPMGYLPEAAGVREGDRLLCEIRAYPSGAKAWPVTRRTSLRSRRLALTPGAPGLNVSRAVKDKAARAEIRAALETALGGEPQVGCVARSVCGSDREGLAEEALWLLERWRKAQSGDDGLRLCAPGAISLALRDWAGRPGAAPARLLAEGDLSFALQQGAAPSDPIRERIASQDHDLFESLDVWGQAQAALTARQPLGSGGAMTLEPTQALTAVDVDSGDGAATAADVEAARALPRLLRLGGHGGLIAADFLARAEAQRKGVEAALGEALARDPVETEILGWTAGGMLELRRKRARRRLTATDLAVWVGDQGES